MANAIKKISVERGYDVTRYALNCFGGAGGQHACLVADALGMTRVLIHPFSGLLSAYGMGLADIRALRTKAVGARLESAALAAVETLRDTLTAETVAELAGQGVTGTAVTNEAKLHLRYEGTDTALPVTLADIATMTTEFEERHRSQFGFISPGEAHRGRGHRGAVLRRRRRHRRARPAARHLRPPRGPAHPLLLARRLARCAGGAACRLPARHGGSGAGHRHRAQPDRVVWSPAGAPRLRRRTTCCSPAPRC